MEATLAILNELETSKLVKRYAIGGAMAAFFYSEAVLTEDLDAFVLLDQSASGLVCLARSTNSFGSVVPPRNANTSGWRERWCS